MPDNRQYEDFSATALYCGRCGRSMPVRERLLLVLPDGYLFEYICSGCGAGAGEEKSEIA
jgi:hypothetical protein